MQRAGEIVLCAALQLSIDTFPLTPASCLLPLRTGFPSPSDKIVNCTLSSAAQLTNRWHHRKGLV